MTDEAHFHLNGYLNKQDLRFWGTENPRCCISINYTLSDTLLLWNNGPYFFENDDEHAENVTGASYRTRLENYLRPLVENNHDIWFQQNGATAILRMQQW